MRQRPADTGLIMFLRGSVHTSAGTVPWANWLQISLAHKHAISQLLRQSCFALRLLPSLFCRLFFPLYLRAFLSLILTFADCSASTRYEIFRPGPYRPRNGCCCPEQHR